MRKKSSCTELTRLIFFSMKDNVALPITLLGGMISRMHTTLAITFMLLWVNSFIGSYLEDSEDAKSLYVNLNIACGCIALLTFFPIGKATDTISPKILTPIAFGFFGICISMVYFINDPTSWTCYATWCMITFSGMFMGVVVSAYYSKILPKEGRGIFMGLYALVDISGQALIIKVGGDLFNTIGRNAPFLLMSIFAGFYMLFSLLMIFFNLYGNLPKNALESNEDKTDENELEKKDELFDSDSLLNSDSKDTQESECS
eukprot:CAMPEP_0202978952 /NCGR_PEP_ID=MMETSP1396-20130829/85231_1 /ASSEMBLY_ACC=CAM_ASM_000872 /TAXON_ID= /ORGANISM="Pseudokeronopsis sp., Strain Brazil" /LENGTH=258 /DNA_ID=CAMNT_0049718147 /DNA_START=562 /DNA_END=1335 /DNA_ORIENTATION=-